MKKSLTALIALSLCAVLALTLTSCGPTTGTEDTTDEFIAATVDVSQSIPVSESEIIAFYNDILTKIQLPDTFTQENKPGLKTNESIHIDNINVLSYDKTTGEATESDSLNGLNKSAKALKDRILGGIDLSKPDIVFGDTQTSFDSMIYPYDNTAVVLTSEDVVKANSYADGNNLNITITLKNTPEAIANTFGIRDKKAVIEKFNEQCANYAVIDDYTVNYDIKDGDENPIYSEINLSVELEKQDDGTYKTTGRITRFTIKVIADIAATADCVGSFKDNGTIQINFRLTDELNYEFDWLGTADWEPIPSDEEVSE